jgi:hypothetical protein
MTLLCNQKLAVFFVIACTLLATNQSFAFDNPTGSTITSINTGDSTVSNEGLIGPSSGGIYASGVGATITNSGTIITYYGSINSNASNQIVQNALNGIIYMIPCCAGGVNLNSTGVNFTNNGLITTTIPNDVYPGIPVGGVGWGYNTGVYVAGSGAVVVNNGKVIITSSSNQGFEFNANTTSFLNAGEISLTLGSNNFAVQVDSGKTLTSFTNIGTVLSTGTGSYGVYSSGTIATLNNFQGAGNLGGSLTYSGILPTNYNIIVNNVTHYGQLAVTSGTGTMAFGVYGGAAPFTPVTYTNSVGATSTVAASSVNANGKYVNILQGLVGSLSGSIITGSSFSITGATGIYGGYNYSLLANGDVLGNWDLCFGLCNVTTFSVPSGPSTIDTQATLHNSAQRLRSTFNTSAISTNFANMNTYDCNLFDTKGMCISAGGRYTTVDNPNSNSTSAVVVVGYKATPNIRIGGFLDQNVSNNTPTGIKISNKNPLMGIFAVWNQNADGLGVQVKVANAYQDKDVNTTRDVIGTSEAGTGATNLNTQSYVGELSYAFLVNQDKTTLRPYLALRQTTIKQDAYTETGVATPLTYAALKDRSTTALVGLKLNHALTPKATLTASFGIEQDLEHSVDQYSATSSSIANLTSENFNDSIKRTRPVASAGAYYAVSKTQRISGDVFYQQLPFQSTGSTTAYINYMIGL